MNIAGVSLHEATKIMTLKGATQYIKRNDRVLFIDGNSFMLLSVYYHSSLELHAQEYMSAWSYSPTENKRPIQELLEGPT